MIPNTINANAPPPAAPPIIAGDIEDEVVPTDGGTGVVGTGTGLEEL